MAAMAVPINDGTAVQYLRRSVERDKAADRDRGAGQRHANAAQAAVDGRTITRTYDGDWGTSGGRGHRAERHAMAALIADVQAGRVGTIYAHTADRLARDVEYGTTLWNACRDHGVVIRAGSQTFTPGQAAQLTVWAVLMAQAQEDLERMTDKVGDTQDFLSDHAKTCRLPDRPHLRQCHEIGCTKSVDGDLLPEDAPVPEGIHCKWSHRVGQLVYGHSLRPDDDPERVVQTWREEGSYHAAARRLVAEGFPNRHAGMWTPAAVRRVITRQVPAMAKPRGRGKAASASDRPLTGILRCHCGATMGQTTTHTAKNPAIARYRCPVGALDATHGQYVVSERFLMDAVKAEAAKLRLPRSVEQTVQKATGDAARLQTKRQRLTAAWVDLGIDDDEYQTRLAAIDAELAKTEAVAQVLAVPGEVPWDATPATVNEALRAMWSAIHLGPDMRVATFDRVLPDKYWAD
jgi:hypothetical protein